MASTEAMSYIDLLITALSEHEKNLSLLIDRLEKVTKNLEDLVRKNGRD